MQVSKGQRLGLNSQINISFTLHQGNVGFYSHFNCFVETLYHSFNSVNNLFQWPLLYIYDFFFPDVFSMVVCTAQIGCVWTPIWLLLNKIQINVHWLVLMWCDCPPIVLRDKELSRVCQETHIFFILRNTADFFNVTDMENSWWLIPETTWDFRKMNVQNVFIDCLLNMNEMTVLHLGSVSAASMWHLSLYWSQP